MDVYISCFIDTRLFGYSGYAYALEYEKIPTCFFKRLCEIKYTILEQTEKEVSEQLIQVHRNGLIFDYWILNLFVRAAPMKQCFKEIWFRSNKIKILSLKSQEK